jgi:hydroxyacylglutathione hydrolase
VAETVMAARRLEVVAYEAAGLGDRSYLVHDGARAVVVDAQRDPGPYVQTAADLGVEITLVLETHVHNDYVSGGLALSRRAGASYGVPGGVPFDFASESSALEEGDVLEVGALRIRVLSTPGHTPHHLTFLAQDALGTSTALTGGSLLAGATGRTDLLGPERAASLGEAQWRSVRRLLRELDPATEVLPTHGFGSFCSVGLGTSPASDRLTVGSERLRNPAARLDLGPFLEELVTSRLPIPAYYQHMAPLNRAGAAEPQYRPVPVLTSAALSQLVRSGTVVVDLRPRRQFADIHLRGALNIELAANLSTYFGWLVPFSAPFVVIAPSFDELVEGRRLLSRIGREDPVAWAPADLIGSLPAELLGHYEVATFAGLAQHFRQDERPHVVDVRFPHEWQTGHIKGAENIPLPEVVAVSPTLSTEEKIWAHCAAGYRAAIAASILSARGCHPVLVDDNLDNAPTAGLEIV